MTSNQIEFAKHKETQRHNLALESVEQGKLTETGRHNVMSEKISSGSLDESIRHNKSTEKLSQQQIINNYTLGVRQAAAAERQAQASLNSAQASMAHAGAAYRSADAAMRQAQNTALSIQENIRHNQATESITDVFNRGNLAIGQDKNAETSRHNKISEAIDFADSVFGLAGNVMKGLRW